MPDGDTYKINGRDFSRVTAVLRDTGLYCYDWGTEEARERGRRVHLAAEFLDEGTLDWRSVDDEDEPFVRAWERFKKETKFEVCVDDHGPVIERQVVCTLYGYAGTMDRMGRCDGGRETVVDLKSSESGVISPNVGLQLAAYGFAYDPKRAFDRVAVVLQPERYTVKWFPVGDYYSDAHDFLAAMRLAARAKRLG